MAEGENIEAPVKKKKGGGGLVALALFLFTLGCSGGALSLIYLATFGHVPKTIHESDYYDEFVLERATSVNEPAIYTLEPFTVNLAGKPQRGLKLEINFHMLSEQGFVEVGDINARARDSVVRILSSKTPRDLETIQGKLYLKQQISSEINRHLAMGVVKDIYFTDFVIQ